MAAGNEPLSGTASAGHIGSGSEQFLGSWPVVGSYLVRSGALAAARRRPTRRGHYAGPLVDTMDLISDSLPRVTGQGEIVRLGIPGRECQSLEIRLAH